MHAGLNERRGTDRRKYPRTPVTGAIELRAAGIEVAVTANLRDISAGGCALESRVALQATTALRIELPIPGGKPLVLDANVLRISSNAAERTYRYGVRFRVETATLRDNLLTYIQRYCVRSEAASSDRRERAGVDVKFMVTISPPGVPLFNAMAISLGTGGIRIASDRILRQEWMMKIDMKLPGGMIGAPALTMTGRARPGAKPVRGSYVQDVDFVEPSLRAIAEIDRAMAELRRSSKQAS